MATETFINTPSLFGECKYILRISGEEVEIIASNCPENGARTDEDWVSYIDANGGEHIREHLNLQFDFRASSKLATAFEKLMDFPKPEPLKLPEPPDIWEARRYDFAKEAYFHPDVFKSNLTLYDIVNMADNFIAALKPKDEVIEGVQMDDGYENIGIGEIVDAFSEDGIKHAKKFMFTDRKDIVGFRGDNGRWAVGDRVKVYIKRLEPQEEERPVP